MSFTPDGEAKHTWTSNTAVDRLGRCLRILMAVEGPFGLAAPMLNSLLHLNNTEEFALSLYWLEEMVIEHFPKLIVGLPIRDPGSGAVSAHSMQSLAIGAFFRAYVNRLPLSPAVAHAAASADPRIALLLREVGQELAY